MKPKIITHFKNNIQSFCLCVLLFGTVSQVKAQIYPFVVDNNITATFEVQTSNQEVFKNPLLGTNISGFNSSTEKDFIRKFDPATIRFPHGLFANWYDWRQDKTRVFGTETFNYIHRDSEIRSTEISELAAINTFDRNNIKVGIDGLEQLNKERKIATGNGFDMMWTFNMSADAEVDGADFSKTTETLARYDNLKARGFEVKDIELGNECFYPGQRSSFIPNASDFVARAKSMSAALKLRDPTIQVSIPLLRRGSFVDPNWNAKLTQDLTYFDAVTVHTYIGADPDNSANSDLGYGTALTARKSLEDSTNDFVRIYTGNKPIWLTEWGVSSGGPNAASVLGMADCYLFMAENQNIYHRSNWFSVNGKLNSFVVWDGNSIKYPLQKTAFGLTHGILKSVFENSTLLNGTMTTANLVDGVKAVSARAVTKNGKITVFVLNLTDKAVPFNLKIDGALYANKFIHKAMKFDNVGQGRVLPVDEDPLLIIKEGSGAISLPPLSINTIYLGSNEDPQPPIVNLTSPLPYSSHLLANAIPLNATATDSDGTIAQVEFKVNDTFLATDTASPYEATFNPAMSGTYKISAIATDNDGKTSEISTLIYILAQEPFTGTPMAIPGIIESEDYDKGGQNVAYNDTDTANRGGAYRLSEGVDVGTIPSGGYSIGYVASGEWIKYTVNVEETGKYDLVIKYSSGRSGGGTVNVSANDVNLIGNHTLLQTAGWNDYKTSIIKDLQLVKGIQVLKVTINGGGYNLDNLTFSRGTLSVADFETTKIMIYPNPSKNGVFMISEPLSWELYSLSGLKLKEGKEKVIDISSLSKGIYLLKTGTTIVKLIHQ